MLLITSLSIFRSRVLAAIGLSLFVTLVAPLMAPTGALAAPRRGRAQPKRVQPKRVQPKIALPVTQAPGPTKLESWWLAPPSAAGEAAFLQTQLTLVGRASNEREKARLLGRLAGVEAQIGLLDEAQNHAEEATRIGRRLKAGDEVAVGLLWQTHIAAARGDHQTARRGWEQTLAAAPLPRRLEVCRLATSSLGWEEIAPELLLDASRTGARLSAQLGGKTPGTRAEFSLFRAMSGRALWRLGLHQSALNCWTQLRRVELKELRPPDAGRCVAALSESEAQLFWGNNDLATQSVAMARQFLPPRDPELALSIKLSSTRTKLQSRLPDQAQQMAAEAVNAANQLPPTLPSGAAKDAWLAEALTLQSQIFFEAKQGDEAQRTGQKALTAAQAPGAEAWQPAAALALSRALWAKKDREPALSTLLDALSKRDGLSFETVRSCGEDSLSPDCQAVAWLLEQGRAREAWNRAEAARQTVLSGQLQQAGLLAEGSPGGSPADAAYRGAVGLLWANRRTTQQPGTPRAMRLSRAQSEFESQSLALAATRPEVGWASGKTSVDSRALALKLQNDGALLCLFPLGSPPGNDSASAAAGYGSTAFFQVTARGGELEVQGRLIPSDLDALASTIAACRNPKSDAGTPLRKLSAQLEPFLGAVSGFSRLYIAPSGPWWQVPFAALPDTKGRALLLDHQLQVVPGAFWLTLPSVNPFAKLSAPISPPLAPGENRLDAGNPPALAAPQNPDGTTDGKLPSDGTVQDGYAESDSLVIFNPRFAGAEKNALASLAARLSSPASVWPSPFDVIADSHVAGERNGRGLVADGRIAGAIGNHGRGIISATGADGRGLVADGRALVADGRGIGADGRGSPSINRFPYLTRGGLRPLENTVAQFEAFADAGLPVTTISGPNATATTFATIFNGPAEADKAPSRLVWGASHLLWSVEKPFESGLALAPSLRRSLNESDAGTLWSWREAALSRRDVGVMLWSEADTLDDSFGDGQTAMLWSLRQAGIGGVGWTLWSESGPATQFFASRFAAQPAIAQPEIVQPEPTQLQRELRGSRSLSAFTAAQRDVAAQPEFAHPFFWANWRFAGNQ